MLEGLFEYGLRASVRTPLCSRGEVCCGGRILLEAAAVGRRAGARDLRAVAEGSSSQPLLRGGEPRCHLLLVLFFCPVTCVVGATGVQLMRGSLLGPCGEGRRAAECRTGDGKKKNSRRKIKNSRLHPEGMGSDGGARLVGGDALRPFVVLKLPPITSIAVRPCRGPCP